MQVYIYFENVVKFLSYLHFAENMFEFLVIEKFKHVYISDINGRHKVNGTKCYINCKLK